MKKKLFFFPLAAALTLASCSSEEPAYNGGNDKNGEDRYIAVNINTTGDGTRATGDYEYGTAAENAVESAQFIIFEGKEDASKVVKSIEVNKSELEQWEDKTSGENIARISQAVLVIPATGETAPTEKPTDSKYIIALLNTTVSVKDKTLGDIRKEVADYVTGQTENGKFIMSNSVYGSIVDATEITDDKFAKTAEAAKGNPVDIYVERVAAKVSITQGDNFGNWEQTLNINGSDQKIKSEITGIEIANVADKSYLIKNIKGIGDSDAFSGWNASGSYRSFWAVNPTGDNGTVDYVNKSYSDINDANPSAPFYIQENAKESTKNTAVIVTVQHKDENGKGLTFVRIAGKMYTTDGGKNLIASMFKGENYYVKTTESDGVHYTSLAVANMDWATPAVDGTRLEGMDHGWEAHLVYTAPEDGSLVKFVGIGKEGADKDGYKTVTATDINTDLKKSAYRAWYWNEGKSYYFVDIIHNGKDENALKGIVRNHVYKLTLTDINGFGVPVFNPDETIIPEEPKDSKNWYLAARINVLQWRIVDQNVSFGHDY